MSSTYDFQQGFCEGSNAAEKNQLKTSNPYLKNTEKYRGWVRGFNQETKKK